MLYLLLVLLPIVFALYAYLMGRHSQLVLWAAGLTLVLEGYICLHIPLDQSVRLMGTLFGLNPLGQLFIYTFLLLAGAIIVSAQALRQGEFQIPVILFVLGITCAIVLLDDPFVVALLLEIVGLAIVLSTVDRPHEPIGLLPISALMAGLKYLTMMVLSGIALVLGFLTLGIFQDTPQELSLIKLAFSLLVVGFGLGTAVVPFHLWFPDLAGHTSTAVTGTLVALVQGTGLLLLGRSFLRFPELTRDNPTAAPWLIGGAVVAAIVAALLAGGQVRWKRLAAYAASYDVALILFAFGLAGAVGLQTGFFLTLHHGLAMVLLLTCVGTLEWSTGRDDVAGLVGVGYRMPLVGLGLIVAILSLAGIPPFLGFSGRWPLYLEALARSWLYLAGIFAAGAFFLLAMVRALWPLLLPAEQTVTFRQPPWPVLVVIGLLIVALLVLGIYPAPVLAVLREAVMGLGGP